MPTSALLELAEVLDTAGFAYLEVSGGGAFDAAVRRGVESPWERIRALKAHTKTPLAMAVRGRFLVGARPVSGDVVRRFVASAAESGIDVFRLHDPLNDVENLREAAEAIATPAASSTRACCTAATAATRSSRPRSALPEHRRRARAAARSGRAAAARARGRARRRAARALGPARRPLLPGRGAERARDRAGGRPPRRRPDRVRRLSGRALRAPHLGRGRRRGARRARARHRRRPGRALEGGRPRRRAPRRHARDAAAAADRRRAPRGGSFRSRSSPRPTSSCARATRAAGSTRCSTRSSACASRPARRRSRRRWATSSPRRRSSTCSARTATARSSTSSASWSAAASARRPARSTRRSSARSSLRGEPRRRRSRSTSTRSARSAKGLASSEEELLLLALFGDDAERLLRSVRERAGGEETPGARGLEQSREERIRSVVKIVQETGIDEITVEEGGMRVSVRRTPERARGRGRPRRRAPGELEEPAIRAGTRASGASRARWSAPSTVAPSRGEPPFVEEGDPSPRARRSASSRR